MNKLIHAILLLGLLLTSAGAISHPMPNSILLMDVRQDGIVAELQLPLGELQLALNRDVTSNSSTLVQRMGAELKSYVLSHIHAAAEDGRAWTLSIRDMQVNRAEQTDSGPYNELTMNLWMQPPAGSSPRKFTLRYDVMMHQLVTHKAIVSIRQDWAGGKVGPEAQTEVGFFSVNPKDNSIEPISVSLDEGSNWRGFKSMFTLGIKHISEGTDHLLFILVLLLPAPLVARGGRWRESGSMKYSLPRLLSIITAFTLGHSLTLLAGAAGWLRLPQGPVELLIAMSVLLTAIHALRPLFPGREAWIAAGFGLVHGLAFASVLHNLQLEGGRMALSILGFNLGVEAMQLFVVVLFVPWLILLSSSAWYKWIRVAGATATGIAAIAWITERITGVSNVVADTAQAIAAQGKWIALGLALCGLVYSLNKRLSPKMSTRTASHR